jgi:hypothetical protein
MKNEFYELLKPFLDPGNVIKFRSNEHSVVVRVPRKHWEQANKACNGLAPSYPHPAPCACDECRFAYNEFHGIANR